MAEDLDESIEIQEESKPASLVKKLLIITIVILTTVLAMIIISNLVFKSRIKEVVSGQQKIWRPTLGEKTSPYRTFSLDTLQLNLSNPTGVSSAFVKMTMALAYEGDDNNQASGEHKKKKETPFEKELNNRKFQIKDRMIQLIGSKSYDELNSPDKQLALKQEMMNQINALLINGVIRDIYFSEFNVVVSK